MRPYTKLEEKNNFKVKWFILHLYECQEISIGRLYSRKVKKMHMDPGLPHFVVDVVHGILSSRDGIAIM